MFAHCTVLHIDDEPDDSALFHRALSRLGFSGEYRHFTRAEEAIAHLSAAQTPPQLIVTDSQLPTGGAIDVIQWVRKNPSLAQVPVVVFSGTVDPGLQRAAFERGATAFFSKSGNLERIAEAIRTLVERSCETAA